MKVLGTVHLKQFEGESQEKLYCYCKLKIRLIAALFFFGGFKKKKPKINLKSFSLC